MPHRPCRDAGKMVAVLPLFIFTGGIFFNTLRESARSFEKYVPTAGDAYNCVPPGAALHKPAALIVRAHTHRPRSKNKASKKLKNIFLRA
jgi:hypothetical protein